MIDFRYHLVSIVAVFLALAIGIVLGSTELQGPVYNALNHTTSALENQLGNADNQRDTAQQGLSADNAMLASSEAWDVRGMLDGQRVVVFTEVRHRREQRAGVLGGGRGEQRLSERLFNHAAGAHNEHSISYVGDHAHVVRDQQRRGDRKSVV